MNSERYSRQLILPGFGPETQQKLTNAKVLVVGAGGLGCPVIQYLSAAGTGCIGVIDFDTVAVSNLHRQLIYDEKDIGRQKTEVVQEKINAQNSAVTIHAYPYSLSPDNAFDLITPYQIVVDCTDNFATRYLVNDVCHLLGKPLVFASIFRFEGQLSVFHYGANPGNLRDLFPEIPDPATVPSCNEAGVTGVLTSIMGSFQANEVLKIITGTGTVTSGKLLLFHSGDYQLQLLDFAPKAGIFKPLNREEIRKQSYEYQCDTLIHIADLKTLEAIVRQKESVLVDVRNPDEQPKITGFDVLSIPLPLLEQQLNRLSTAKKLVFTCQSGIRSLKAIALVRHHYPEKEYYNIKNGIALFQNENIIT